MVIEPRRVADGFVRRWTRQACELMARAFHLWFGVAVVLCAMSVVLSPLGPFALLPFSFFAYFVSVEIAATADERVVGFSDIPGILRAATMGVRRELWDKRMTLLLIGCLVAAEMSYQQLHPATATATPTASPDLSNVLTWVIGPYSPLVSALAVQLVGAMLQGETVAFGCFSYPLHRAFGLDTKQARTLLYRACAKNFKAATVLEILPLVLLLGAAFLLPVLAPFLMCFLPALSYVAFREIFIDDKGNREPAKKAAPQVAIQGASA